MTNLEIKAKILLEQLGFIVKPFSQQNRNDFANTIYTQFPIGKFRIDFALLNTQVAIETHGSYWHGTYRSSLKAKQLKRKISDLSKRCFLSEQNWQLIEFTELQLNNVEHFKTRILNTFLL